MVRRVGSVLILTTILASWVASIPLKNNGRIIGGETAPERAFPYMAMLKYTNGSLSCGASIIGDDLILTAAHCIEGINSSDVNVVVGTNKLDSGGDKYEIEKIIKHPKSESGNYFDYDISIIKLAKTITFNDKISKIALETEDVGVVDAVVSGWGLTSLEGEPSNDLQFLKLKTITTEECKNRAMTVNEKHICTATPEGQGACFWDSGSPLVSNDRQIGIASFAVPCARGYPDAYVRVHSYKDWIAENSH